MDDKIIKKIILNFHSLLRNHTYYKNDYLLQVIEVLLDLLYSINQIVIVFDAGQNILWINNSCLKLLGYKPEEFKELGIPFINKLIHPEDQYIIEKRSKFFKEGKTFSDIERLKHKNGHFVWLKIDTNILLKHFDGSPVILITTLTDISKYLESKTTLNNLNEENKNLKVTLIDCKLSLREKEILRLIVLGMSGKEIADNLNISFNTVRTHRNNLMRKLNINCTAGLVNFYRENIEIN